MHAIRKNALYLLGIYALVVIGLVGALWNQVALVQKVAAATTVLLAVHEWEEVRFPGGFLEMVVGNLGLDPATVDGDALHAKPIAMVCATTAVALCIPQAPLFTCALLVMGVLEAVIHVAGIKLTHAEKPYTSGMVTAIVYGVVSVAGIALLARCGAVVGLDWALGVLWLLACLGVMEASVWRTAGLSPKDVLVRLRSSHGKRRGA